jgi:BirA family transcriptional regulator, biotin operon repressor / biotin---[acetyl-CoA-carboxylase] ligase
MRPLFDRIHLASVASTQDEARARARSGAPSATVIIADHQTAGRGRAGRSWESAPGRGLWLTLIHRSGRPVRVWPALTSAAALAVCHAIESTGLSPGIRWPNDVLIRGKKVSGILAEVDGDAALIGIGLNVSHAPEDFPEAIRSIATSLAMEAGRGARDEAAVPDRHAILDRLLVHLEAALCEFEEAGADSIMRGVWDRSIVRGRVVRIGGNPAPAGDNESGTIIGEAIGLGGNGEIRVRRADGFDVEIASGTLLGLEDM